MCPHCVATGTALIVAGGYYNKFQTLKTVEVLDTKIRQWYVATDLPEHVAYSSLTLCGELLYLLGGFNKDSVPTSLVYSCSLSSLLLSIGSRILGGQFESTLTRSNKGSPWNKVADLPATFSTSVTLHGQLLAIGGKDSKYKFSTTVYMYQPSTDSWEVVSHLKSPRAGCLATVLPDNQLMLVGGYTTGNKKCDSVEFGRVI